MNEQATSRTRTDDAASELQAAGAVTVPQRLIASCQGLVRNIAWRIHCKIPKHIELDDLIGYGQLGLAQAARDFDESRGGRFTTYAYYRIRGAIFDGLSQMSWFSPSAYHAGRYEKFAGDILGTLAEIDEQAASLNVEDEGNWLAQTSGSLAMVYLSTTSEQADATGAEDDPAVDPQVMAMLRELRHRLRELIDGLPADAGAIIRAAYFEGLTLQEAGRRLGISKAWASRLHAKTIRRLGHALRLMGYDR
jgi:RNA polymerase sigma factor FliA